MHSLHLLLLRHVRFVLCVSWLLQAQVGWGGGVITNCTQGDLEAALVGGGAVTFACSGTIMLTNTLVILRNTVLDASGFDVTLSGGNAVRLFAVTNAAFRVNGLTLADGWSVGASGTTNETSVFPGQDGTGGCILNQGGTVTLTACTLTNHLAQGGDAALVSARSPGDSSYYTFEAGIAGNGLGGAICSFGGQINLTNCFVTGCAAKGGTGGSLGVLSIYGRSGVGLGGAVYLDGSALNLQNVTLTNNRAAGGPGGTSGGPPFYWGAAGEHAGGGALYATNSTVCAGDSLLTGNTAVSGRLLSGLVGSTRNGSGGALFVAADASAALHRCTLSNNTAQGGYAPYKATGGSGLGGAVFNGGSVQLYNSTCSSNSALGPPGTMFGVCLGQGGALYSTGLVVLVGCTFNHNWAQGGANGPYVVGATPGEGGAVWSAGRLCATNCTWATNQAVAGRYETGAQHGPPATPSGGGVYIFGGSAALVNVTFAGNRAAPNNAVTSPEPSWPPNWPPLWGGSLFSKTNELVLVQNSIFVGSEEPGGTNFWGTIIDGGYNLCSDSSGGFTAPTSLMDTDPMLLSLADNGGPTATISLNPGSPARDAIPAGYPPTDQRGVSRPQGVAADIGAVEVASVPTLVTVQTVPAGLSISVDGGKPIPTPHQFHWLPGSCHTLDASNPGSGGQGTNVQYLWTAWGDGGAVSHQVCANGETTNTAFFRRQYYLTMSPGTNFGGTVSPVSGWYDEGQTFWVSAAPFNGFTFSGWRGSGSGTPYSGPDNPAPVTMNGWVAQTAAFTYTNPCSFALSTTNASFPADLQRGAVMVVCPDTNCPWTVVNPCDWITVTSGSPGSPTVNYLVSTNNDCVERTCTLSIAGLPFMVTQAAGRCIYTLSSTYTNIGPAAMSGQVTVNTGSHCSWTATLGCDWLHTTNTGTGTGLVCYTADANPGPYVRIGEIRLLNSGFWVATFQVTQWGWGLVFTNGTYHGLFYPAAGGNRRSVGCLTLSTTRWRTFSGRLFVEGAGHSFHGNFYSAGQTELLLPRRGKPALHLKLQLLGANTLSGSVEEQGGGWLATLHADRAVFSPSHPCPYAGLYTFASLGHTNPAALPGGDSYGTLKVNARGRATLAGSLADGTILSSSTFVAEDGSLPVFEALRRGQGLVCAWVQLPPDATNSLSGEGAWIKPQGSRFYPAGFNETVTFFGRKYTAPMHEPVFHFAEGVVTFAGGNLPDALSVPVKLFSNNKAAPVGASKLWLSLSPSSGKFSGSFSIPPARERCRFQGVLLPQLESGYGYFLGTNQSGYVRIGAQGL